MGGPISVSSIPAHSAEKSLPKDLFGYQVLSRLGEGALSAIYAVRDPRTGESFALKHIIPTDPKHQRFIEQAENEYKVSKLFRHPGLRKAVDYKVRKRLFGGIIEAGLVMELIEGQTIEANRPSDASAVVDIFAKAGIALAAVHHLRHVHCDFKPSNILRTADGRIKVIDFGQTCREGTVKQRVQGTPDFIAPEQIKLKPVGFYTDVYCYGASLYWALTGRRVPTLFTVHKTERDVVKEQKFPRPRELNLAVPAAVSDLVMDCLRVSPGARPQTMAEVLKRMETTADS